MLKLTVHPPACTGSSMTYDWADHYVVMFGGVCAPGYFSYSNQTWKFAAGGWTNISTGHSPPAREFASMTYDGKDGYVLLFGGTRSGAVLGDTWRFSNGTWKNITPSLVSPSARYQGAMAYDARDGYVVLFGGTGPHIPRGWTRPLLNDSWEFKRGTWSPITSIVRPPLLNGPGLTFDAFDNQTFLYGGFNYAFHYTYYFAGGNWSRVVSNGTPYARGDFGLTYDPQIRGVLESEGENGGAHCHGHFCRTTWKYTNGTWSLLKYVGTPLPRVDVAMTFDARDGYTIMFGGALGYTYYNDTYQFS